MANLSDLSRELFSIISSASFFIPYLIIGIGIFIGGRSYYIKVCCAINKETIDTYYEFSDAIYNFTDIIYTSKNTNFDIDKYKELRRIVLVASGKAYLVGDTNFQEKIRVMMENFFVFPKNETLEISEAYKKACLAELLTLLDAMQQHLDRIKVPKTLM